MIDDTAQGLDRAALTDTSPAELRRIVAWCKAEARGAHESAGGKPFTALNVALAKLLEVAARDEDAVVIPFCPVCGREVGEPGPWAECISGCPEPVKTYREAIAFLRGALGTALDIIDAAADLQKAPVEVPFDMVLVDAGIEQARKAFKEREQYRADAAYGCLLRMVREHYSDPLLTLEYEVHSDGQLEWRVLLNIYAVSGPFAVRVVGSGRTEIDAMRDALSKPKP